jgi:hypothetical protein
MGGGQLQEQDRLANRAFAAQRRDAASRKAIPHAPLALGDRFGVVAREVEPHQFRRRGVALVLPVRLLARCLVERLAERTGPLLA